MMTNQAIADPPAGDGPGGENPSGRVTVETRFGRMEFESDATLFMPKGMLGFPGSTEFGLAPLPGAPEAPFRLLQSLNDPAASFPVLPIGLDEVAIDKEDLDAALGASGIPREDAAILLVVTARKSANKVELTVNLRAPVFVDTRRRIARQLVLPNDKYPIRHAL